MLLCILGFWGTQPRLAEAEEANIEHDGEPVSTMDLLKNKMFLYYLVTALLFTAVTGATYSFAPAYLTSLGMEASLASTILSVAAICELPFILLSSKFMDRVSNKVLLIGCSVLLVLQMATYGLGLPLPVVIVITLLCKHPPVILNIMANMKVVNTIVDPRQQIVALSIVKAVQMLGTIVSNNIGGRIIDSMGYGPMFLFLLALIAAELMLLLPYRIPSGNDKKLFS